MENYNPIPVELKWKDFFEKNKTFNTNKEKSKTRARVEHVFGFMEQSMNGLFIRPVGIARVNGIMGLINLTYNLFRCEQVIRIRV